MMHQQHLFDIPEDVSYLNTASLSPSLKTSEIAGLESVLQKSRPFTIPTSNYFEPVTKLKQLFAKVIDVDNYNRIATIPSVSYGIATVTKNITLNPEDEILIIGEQFPSNYYAWQKLADQNNATIKTVTIPQAQQNRTRDWNTLILNSISSNTAVIAMGNIHWSNGSLFNLKAISKKAKANNSLLIIDGSQSIGALPFSVKEINPDAVICAGYKWLFGPYGCAYAYFGAYFDNGEPIEENWTNRLNSENLSQLTQYQNQYKPLANRYCAGEHASFIYVNMQIKALEQVLKWSPLDIQNYCKLITKETVNTLQGLGCFIDDDHYRSHHLFGVELPKTIDIDLLKTKLTKQKIYVSFRGKYIRLSCHYFNTERHFKKLVNCIKSVIINN
ncbi:aminotransferase class V-fold PLP-dependent enzyme [Lacinutrix sp. 5H-3-7-4]|uniref:aminotransferase class V-fold PLP-dependent enzyme n=1 Tax=Lacinutrix sp. (strain 5H-3-7-4) TaxID=983544 RepID=UPI00020A3434|nr:aminotransferase class V-fold PLP-dependent enzyme [Lacinutrix sp. 5H-3-7-4]AEH02597.1 aminotransferase class V [Lacinutrix sp. 5H-3-7-4]